jgi:two-component system C4-dicarboxylate transport response regulator DctD
MTRGRIAFVDDEPDLCAAAADWLEASGFEVMTHTDPRQALDAIDPAACDCVVSDIRMPGLSGLDLLERLTQTDQDLPVILLTGHGDVPVAVDAMRAGAYHFLEKPYDAEQLVSILDNAVEKRRLVGELARLRRHPDDLEARLIGTSASIVELRRAILHLADIDVDMLITGETGTGKEVAARALHDFGRRRAGPFVAINCAAIPESIFESEVFGHEKGAYTGAAGVRQGKLAYASGGTVFFDEIESMPLALQAKVLRVIQERVVEPLGSNTPIPIDVRFIGASKADLRQESEAGRFRPDLYFRLSTIDLALPPLRSRRDDIALLHTVFARRAAERFGLPMREPSPATLAELATKPWPGNVRELKGHAERSIIGIAASGPQPGHERPSLPEQLARFEAAIITEALAVAAGSSAQAAEALGIPRRTLNEKIARYGLRSAEAGGFSPA